MTVEKERERRGGERKRKEVRPDNDRVGQKGE